MFVMKEPGDINSHRQRLLRITHEQLPAPTGELGVLICLDCGFIYGRNTADFRQSQCPVCQDGFPSVPVPAERDGINWTREEHLLAFRIYNEIPFGKIDEKTPKVRSLAALLGRKVGSASYKLANFSRLDPVLAKRGIKGLVNGAKGEAEVWEAFWKDPESLAFESERLFAERTGGALDGIAPSVLDLVVGTERETVVKVRVNQAFFRRRVISAFRSRCCVTGLMTPALLTASHIIRWADDPANRLNPLNGLCLNALHDRAFDRYLMWVDDELKIRFSPKLAEVKKEELDATEWLRRFEGRRLLLPFGFQPSRQFLRKHREECLKNL
jgi:putative restriction endonuclease